MISTLLTNLKRLLDCHFWIIIEWGAVVCIVTSPNCGLYLSERFGSVWKLLHRGILPIFPEREYAAANWVREAFNRCSLQYIFVIHLQTAHQIHLQGFNKSPLGTHLELVYTTHDFYMSLRWCHPWCMWYAVDDIIAMADNYCIQSAQGAASLEDDLLLVWKK